MYEDLDNYRAALASSFKLLCRAESDFSDAIQAHMHIAKVYGKDENDRSKSFLSEHGSDTDRPRIHVVSGPLDAAKLRRIIDEREACAAQYRELLTQHPRKNPVIDSDAEADEISAKHVLTGARITAPMRLICADSIEDLTPENFENAIRKFNDTPPLKAISYRTHEAQTSRLIRTDAQRAKVAKVMVEAAEYYQGKANEYGLILKLLTVRDFDSLRKILNAEAHQIIEDLEHVFELSMSWDDNMRAQFGPFDLQQRIDEIVENWTRKLERLIEVSLSNRDYFLAFPEILPILPDNFTFRRTTGNAFYIKAKHASKSVEFRLGTVDVIKSDEGDLPWRQLKSKPSRALLTHVYHMILLPHAEALAIRPLVDEIVSKYKTGPSC